VSDDLLDRLRSLDPAPRTTGAARSGWGEAALRRVLEGRVRRHRRWTAAAAAVAGAAGLVALFLVLILSSRGGQTATAGSARIALAPLRNPPTARQLDATVLALGRRADALGLRDVAVTRSGSVIVVRLSDPARVDDLIEPGRLRIVGFGDGIIDPLGRATRSQAAAAAGPGGLVVRGGRRWYALPAGAPAVGPVDIAGARYVTPARTLPPAPARAPFVSVSLTAAGQRTFRRITRTATEIAVVFDGTLIRRQTIDHRQFPEGLSGREGMEFAWDGRGAVLAAQIATPLPLRLARYDAPPSAAGG
jgi:hypothetical protein